MKIGTPWGRFGKNVCLDSNTTTVFTNINIVNIMAGIIHHVGHVSINLHKTDYSAVWNNNLSSTSYFCQLKYFFSVNWNIFCEWLDTDWDTVDTCVCETVLTRYVWHMTRETESRLITTLLHYTLHLAHQDRTRTEVIMVVAGSWSSVTIVIKCFIFMWA